MTKAEATVLRKAIHEASAASDALEALIAKTNKLIHTTCDEPVRATAQTFAIELLKLATHVHRTQDAVLDMNFKAR